MNYASAHYPWMFHRNEIDLLEDELEDLYEKYHCRGCDVVSTEAAVIHEQMDTEEQSDDELFQRLGCDFVDDPCESFFTLRGDAVESEEEWTREMEHVRRHPLFRYAQRWATLVKQFSKERYEEGGVYAGVFFRIYANINLIPLKIFSALAEEMYGDRVGCEIALEEYRLACIYLERVLESLELITFVVADLEWLQESRRSAQVLREALTHHTNSLRRRMSLV